VIATTIAERNKTYGAIDTRPAILGGIAVIAFVLFGLVGWAATAPVASAVIAQGVVVVDGKRKEVQHLEGGIVHTIFVRDGAKVAANQILIRLDEARARATLGVVQTALDAARVLEARLKSERDDVDLLFPQDLMLRRDEPTLVEMMQAQKVLLEARRSSFQGQQSILRQRIAQYEQEIGGLDAQRVALEKQMDLVEDELEGLRELLAKGIAPKTKVLALEREAARLLGSRGERVADIARAQVVIGGTKLEMLQAERTFRENVVKDIRDVQAQIADLQERLAVAKSTLDHIEIRAPVAGTVVGLNAHTKGGVIKPGETILEIVPDAERLIIEGQIQPADIDNTTPGMETDIRLTAFKQRTTPVLVGRLIYVSADRISDPRSGAAYYLARVEVPEHELDRIRPQVLQAGMPAEILIRKRDRTALEYLVQPVMDAMGRAWHED
jgi:HlyD family type I secretion membrane fusion protein